MKIILIGTIGVGKTTVGRWLVHELGLDFYSIDDLRREFSDGSVAGEYLAYSELIRHIQGDNPCILEFSGCGIHKHTIRYALSIYKQRHVIIHILLDEKKIRERLNQRLIEIPYPFPSSIDSLIEPCIKEIEEDLKASSWENDYTTQIIQYLNSENLTNLSIPPNSFYNLLNQLHRDIHV